MADPATWLSPRGDRELFEITRRGMAPVPLRPIEPGGEEASSGEGDANLPGYL